MPFDQISFRAPEINDCTLLDTSATRRIDYGDFVPPNIDGRAIKQTFTMKYKKPLTIGSTYNLNLEIGLF